MSQSTRTGHERHHARRGQRGSEEPPESSEHDAVCERLADDPAPSRTEGSAGRQLRGANGSTGHEQVGHVGHGDQHEDPDGAEEDE
jgi:hypothetical protein